MTEQTQPTDAEIEALGHRMCWRYKHDTGVNHISTFTFNAQTLHDFARAVLAKWGTPAGAGEPLFWYRPVCGGEMYEGPFHTNSADAKNLRAYKPDEWKPLFTTPQPTQAQAGAVPQHQPTPDVQAKMAVNQWDHFGDILPTLKAISRGDWYWGANSRCKYIEIRLDTRDGGCLLFDRERVRISPAQFAHQSHSVRMEPWPGIKGADHG